ncbi:MAG: TPM domain-containing protein [Oscillospiraceae bacterium]|nr:TPM domain-containing protein [Oscillospiraceae bacterium]
MKGRKLSRLFAVAAAFLCSLTLFALPASAKREESYIMNCKLYDEDQVFDSAAEEALSAEIRQASDETDMYVAVIIRGPDAPAYSDSEIQRRAEQAYLDLFKPKTATDADGLILYLNLSTRYAYIATSGIGQLYYSNSDSHNRVDQMVENMKSSLQSGNYSGAVSRFCSDVRRYYSEGIPRGAYSKDDSTGTYYWEENGELVSGKHLPLFYGKNWSALIGIGAVAGLIAALITYLVIRSRYKLVKSLSATNYISQQETQFYVRDDLFIRTHTTKTHIDSGGGGGGGGGGHSHMSGGHSFGGGGGHW